MDKPRDRIPSRYAKYSTPRYAHYAASGYAQHAIKLLGATIHNERIKKKMTMDQVAERAGVSRGRVSRIEKGDMGCSIGAVFEVAALVGVQLFDADRRTLAQHVATAQKELTLLPQRARIGRKAVKDDF